MIESKDLIAVARIISFDKKNQTFSFTFGGDSLKELTYPLNCYLLFLHKKPISSSEVLMPAVKGLSDDMGRYLKLTISKITFKNNKGILKFQKESQNLLEDELEEIKGAWICLEKKILEEETSGTYVFQFMDAKIYDTENAEPIARVVDFYDNGAQGILVTVMADGTEVLIPFVDQYVTFNKKTKTMKIPDFNLFVPA